MTSQVNISSPTGVKSAPNLGQDFPKSEFSALNPGQDFPWSELFPPNLGQINELPKWFAQNSDRINELPKWFVPNQGYYITVSKSLYCCKQNIKKSLCISERASR